MKKISAGVLAGTCFLCASCSGADAPANPEVTTSEAITSSPGHTSAAGTPSATGADPAARPMSIELSGLDPCTAIPADALAAIGSETARSGSDRTGSTELACSYLNFNSPYGSALFFDSGNGYETFGRSGQGVLVTAIDVSGYRAFSVQKPSRAACTVGVDIADSQSLSTTTIGSFDEPVSPLCDEAAKFAATAITVLTTK